jgi:RHS repeat-associated protein
MADVRHSVLSPLASSLAYDDFHRLTSVPYPGPTTTTYDFDAFGNRTEMVAGGNTTTYDYDDADRLETVTPPSPASPVAYTWDDNGNLTDRGSDAFSWDFEDRMTSATVNSVTTTFVYRGDGLRDSRAVSGGATTTFTWDIASGLPVVLDDGNQYVYGAGLTSMKQGGNWYYYLADGLGSTMAVVDSSGASQRSYTYDVYGEVTGGSGSLANELGFAGQQTDGTGMQYLRARYYDPETGTFLSRDPLASKPTWFGKSYGFGNGNSANVTDPTGLCGVSDPWNCGDDAVNAVSAAFNGTVDAARAAGGAIAAGAGWTADRIVAIAEGAAAIATEGMGRLASAGGWLAQSIWHQVRASVNAQLSALALGLAASKGLDCRALRNGLTGCFGATFLSGSAMTLGNVILINDKKSISDELLDHEEWHANQWAWFALSTPNNPLIGQSVIAVSYLALDGTVGPCKNPYDWQAGWENGGYEQCLD